MLIVGEYVLLYFVDPICWPASQKLVVFRHPGDQLFGIFNLQRSHFFGGRWQRLEVGWNVLMVLSGVWGVVVVVGIAVAMRIAVEMRKERSTLRSPSLNDFVEC